MENQTLKYKCGKCGPGTIVVEHKISSKNASVLVKKCDNCKHQYYFKQLGNLHPIPTT